MLRRIIFNAFLLALGFSSINCSGGGGTAVDFIFGGNLPGDVPIDLVLVADGVIQPVNMASPNDGTGRLFVVSRMGKIRIVENGELLDEPFLDIGDEVITSYGEQGLLDIAFHPDFVDNGYFFVDYTSVDGDGDTVVARYRVSPGDPDKADPASKTIIIQLDQPAKMHNGGKITFGPDGYLYIATGQGGAPVEFGLAQSLTTYMGKLLRIDVDSEPGVYTIPPDNPFVDITNARHEIWDYGLRNPWQFCFDRLTGDIYIADVGHDKWEEIDFEPAGTGGGVNYGWGIMEGKHCFPDDPCVPVGVPPVFEYGHDLGCSITGIGIYRGDRFPKLDGIYFYGDFCTGTIWGLARDANGVWVSEELIDTSVLLTGAGEDEDGNLYVTSYGPDYVGPGYLWRLEAA